MLKWLRWKLLGRATVVIVDFDKYESKRVAKKINGVFTTYRWETFYSPVYLLKGGETQGVGFVESWHSIYPPFLHLPEGSW